jgi:hypothetical protein
MVLEHYQTLYQDIPHQIAQAAGSRARPEGRLVRRPTGARQVVPLANRGGRYESIGFLRRGTSRRASCVEWPSPSRRWHHGRRPEVFQHTFHRVLPRPLIFPAGADKEV